MAPKNEVAIRVDLSAEDIRNGLRRVWCEEPKKSGTRVGEGWGHKPDQESASLLHLRDLDSGCLLSLRAGWSGLGKGCGHEPAWLHPSSFAASDISILSGHTWVCHDQSDLSFKSSGRTWTRLN